MMSMTGFAALDGAADGIGWRWEIRSVNARGLDLKFRVPPGFEALDGVLRPRAREAVTRGSVSASLSVFQERGGAAAKPDPQAIRSVVDLLREVRETAADAGLPVAPLTGETLVPLLLAQEASARSLREEAETLAVPVAEGFVATLARLVEAREAEGARLSRIIGEQLSRIESLVRDAEEEAEEAVAVLRARLLRQVRELVDGETMPDAGRLEQEVALLAARADVREEIDRLRAHVGAARDLVAAEGPVGRKLDFLTQEFNREANTLCSKSATDALTRIGLDLKATIDQLREQAANVE